MALKSVHSFITGLFGAIVLTLGIGLSVAAQDASLPEFAGSQTCTACHQEQADLWNGSDHSWAWRTATDENVLGDFNDVAFTHQGIETRFYRDGEDFFFETADEQGELQSYLVSDVIGVRPLQQYLTELDDGKLQVLDVAWDTENDRWFMVFPEQDDNIPGNALHWSGVYKNFNGRCAECHATNFDKGYENASRSFSSQWSEIGVTCEACHGPGKAHVAWAQDADLAELSDYLGIDKVGLVRRQADDDLGAEIKTCAACHSRRTAFADSSPAVGSVFSNSYDLALLRPELYHPDGQIKDEVYVLGSFLQSKMNAAGVTCSNCHEPHSGKVRAQDNTLCTQCHSEEGSNRFEGLQAKVYDNPAHTFHPPESTGAQCVACHMPQTTYMAIDARRDHRFGIPDPAFSAVSDAPNACTNCHQDQTPEWAAEQLENWFPNSTRGPGFARVFASVDGGDTGPASRDALMSIAGARNTPAIIRASALERIGQTGPLDQKWPELEAYLQDVSPIVRTATARLFQTAPDQVRLDALAPVVEDPRKSVRIEAAKGLLGIPPNSYDPADRNAIFGAVGEFQQSLLAGSDHPSTQMGMAGLALSMRNIDAATAAINEALVLDPQLTDGWIMRARLETALQRPDLVETTMEEALRNVPDSVVLLQFFGTYLAGQRKFNQALFNLQKAVTLSGGDAGLRTDYAAVLGQSGRYDDAIAELNILIREQGQEPTLLFLKANFQGRGGNEKAAKRTLRKLQEIAPDYPLPDDLLELLR